MKSLFAALCALALVSARPPLPAATEAWLDPSARPEVVQIRCATSAGSAFYVGPHTLVTVAHVLAGKCRAGEKWFTVLKQEGDFAILRVDEPSSTWLRIDCGGFVEGRVYTAWGFARGLPTLTSVDAEARGIRWNGFSRLWGVFHVIPGQSGGPFIDQGGAAVGSVNVFDPFRGDSGSVALKETSLCR